MFRIADDAPGAAASAGKFVAGRYSPNAQRRANQRRSNAAARTSIGGHGHSIRMVNKTAGGHDRLAVASRYLRRARRTFFATGKVFD
jgi:hypothetical protein